MIEFKKETLKSGLSYFEAPLHDTQAITILVLVGVGSRYEVKEENGISHFLEHLFFKGTKKRPSTLKLSKELDAMGARYNAFTGEEATGFYITAARRHFKKAWSVLSDMLLDPLLAPKEVERERGVILEEMNMYYDTPQSYVQELAKAAVFGDTPLGRDIIGTKETIRSISPTQIAAYRQHYYLPSNMTVVVAGAELGNCYEEVASALSGGEAARAPKYQSFDNSYVGKPVSLLPKKTDQTHLVINIKTFAATDPRRYTLQILSNVLGGQMSSRLFIKIRERRGLAYYVYSDTQHFHDTGLLSISAGLRTSHTASALELIRRELMALASRPVGKEELSRAKENVIGRGALALEGSFPIAQFIAEQHFYEGKIRQPEELNEEYRKVTAQDIMKLASELFTPSGLHLAMIGPVEEKDKNKFGKIISS